MCIIIMEAHMYVLKKHFCTYVKKNTEFCFYIKKSNKKNFF